MPVGRFSALRHLNLKILLVHVCRQYILGWIVAAAASTLSTVLDLALVDYSAFSFNECTLR